MTEHKEYPSSNSAVYNRQSFDDLTTSENLTLKQWQKCKANCTSAEKTRKTAATNLLARNHVLIWHHWNLIIISLITIYLSLLGAHKAVMLPLPPQPPPSPPLTSHLFARQHQAHSFGAHNNRTPPTQNVFQSVIQSDHQQSIEHHSINQSLSDDNNNSNNNDNNNPHQAHIIKSSSIIGSELKQSNNRPVRSDSIQEATTSNKQSADVNDASQQQQAAKLQQANSLETNALNYLQRYGYMNPVSGLNQETSNNLITEDSFSNAIVDFQRFANIATTGVVDNETLELMQLPRCGNSDKWRPPQPTLATLASAGEPQVRKVGQLNRRLSNSSRQLSRQRRYALQGSKWRRQELTYRISQYPTRFSGKKNEVDEQIGKAFGIWSHVAPIDFIVKREGRVHIDIRFAGGDHGDGDAFDGPGNTLAHAYFPQYGGDAHFDDQEYWTIDSYAGTNIFQVAAHELGHSLGLGHSNVREALMAPFYQKYKPNFRLHVDDILAIQALYGEKPLTSDLLPSAAGGASSSPASSTSTTTTTTTAAPARKSSNKPAYPPPIYKGHRRPADDPSSSTTTTTTTTTTIGHEDEENEISNKRPDSSAGGDSSASPSGQAPPSSAPTQPADLCSDPVIDAITRTEDGNSYVFKGEFYWLLAQDGLARGYPRRISQDWEGLPGNLDAALTWADGKTFFFKGNKYWRFRNKRRDVGYPKLISSGFSGIPDDIEAAFVWSGNGRTYFFKGTEYWRFDSKADPPVSSEYPRSIKVWLGVPSYINAAFKWENNVTYFFKGNQYYRFNDREFKVESRGRPAFPRSTAEWWFGCVSNNLAQRAWPSASGNLHNAEESSIDRPIASPTRTNAGGVQRPDEPGDWSFLAGLEETSRSMGTHISDHHGQRSPPPTMASEEPTSPSVSVGIDGGQPQIVTVDGPSGAQPKSARQPRQHEHGPQVRPGPGKFEDFGWPMPRPRGGDMGTTLFSSSPTSNGSGLGSRTNTANSNQSNNLILSGVLLTSAILIACSMGYKNDHFSLEKQSIIMASCGNSHEAKRAKPKDGTRHDNTFEIIR